MIFHLLIHLEDFISLNKKKEFENILITAALNFEFIFYIKFDDNVLKTINDIDDDYIFSLVKRN